MTDLLPPDKELVVNSPPSAGGFTGQGHVSSCSDRDVRGARGQGWFLGLDWGRVKKQTVITLVAGLDRFILSVIGSQL